MAAVSAQEESLKAECRLSEVSGQENEAEMSEKKLDETKKDVCTEEDVLDIVGNGQLRKKVLKPGQPDSRPANGSLVRSRVKVYLEDGTQVQDSIETYLLTEGDVIVALDMCTGMMNEGETAEISTAARFAYGSLGREPDIPADAALTMEVELLKVCPPPNVATMSVEELLRFGEKKRERGNTLFARGEYSTAIGSYSRALTYFEARGRVLKGEEVVLHTIAENRIKCYNNMAAAQLKIGASSAVIRSCNIVLSSQPDNVKALYRMGKAFCACGKVDKAIETIKKAIKLDPSSKLLLRELSLWTQKQKREMESEKNMYKKMMGNMADAAMYNKKPSGGNMMKATLIVGGVMAAMFSVGFAYYRTSH